MALRDDLDHPVLATAGALAADHGVDALIALDCLGTAVTLMTEGLRPVARGRGGRLREMLRIALTTAEAADWAGAVDTVVHAEAALRRRLSAPEPGLFDQDPPATVVARVRAALTVPVLRPGGHLRVIAGLRRLGFSTSFAAGARETGFLHTAPARTRVRDLHQAFADDAVDGILSVVGGSRCVDLLPYLDWDLLANHPKPLCGYSDVTTLLNAVYARVGLVTFSGPHMSSFAMDDDYQASTFSAVLGGRRADLRPAPTWSDEPWYLSDAPRTIRPNPGWLPLRSGYARGTLLGGNLSCFVLLLASDYAPSLAGSVLLLEDTEVMSVWQIRRALVTLAQHPGFGGVRGIVLGRFQRGSGLTREVLVDLADSLPDELRRIPVLAEVDAGHTQPIATFPVGGIVELVVGDECRLTIFPDS